MKKKAISLFAILILSFAAVGLGTGCQTTLQKDGVYQGDEFLYNADRVIVSSYSLFQSFVEWEHNFRDVLPNEVTDAANQVRANAERWTQSAIALREAYAHNPTSANRTALEKAVAVLEAALAEAARYMTDYELRRIQEPKQ